MKLVVETVIEGTQREGLAWGAGEDGSAILMVLVGSRRVLVSMAPEEALECAIGGAYVGQGLRMARAQQQGATPPQAMLTDASGVPLSRRS